MNRTLLKACTLAAALGLLATACRDTPTQQRAQMPTPQLGVSSAGNGSGACMGVDALASGFTAGLSDSTSLNCTANDIVIAFATIQAYRVGPTGTFTTLAPGARIACAAGDTVYAVTSAFLQNNAQSRYDVGVWIATDGGNAQTGVCNQYNLIPGQHGALSLEPSPNGDQCGDMAQGAGLVEVPLDTLKIACTAAVDSVSIGACLGWENSDVTSKRGLCPTTPPGGALGFRYGTVPETKSKCNCQPFFLPIDVRGTITIIKHVAGGNGTFSFSQDVGTGSDPAVANPFLITTVSGSGTQQFLKVAAGTYHIAESGPPAGFAFDSASCTTGGTVSSQTATITIHGNSVTCNFYNHKQPKIALVKRIVNDNGGTAVVGDFAITTTAGNPGFGSGVAHGDTMVYTGSTLTVSPGAYTLHEGTFTGYSEGTWSCTAGNVTNNTPASGSVTLAAGDSAVCTIINDDIGGLLTLVKRIVNDNGGAKVVGDFGITTDAGSLTFGTGVADGTSTLKYTSNTLNVNAGSYTLHENVVTGYSEGSWSCNKGLVSGDPQTGSVAVALSDSVTCTITNNDIAGHLTLVKRIVNDNGGTAAVGDFGITTTGGALTFGTGAADGANTLKYTSNMLTVNADTFSLHEGTLAGYTEGDWSCNKGLVSGDPQTGSVAVGNADTVTCTITNNDIASSLTLVKRIVNDDGGTKVVGDFGLTTDAGSLTFGGGVADGTSTLKYTSNTLPVNAGTYTLVENNVTGYTEGTWSCTGNSGSVVSTFNAGSVGIGLSETVVCTITNNDIPGQLTLVKRIVNDDGGTAAVGDFGITTTGGSLTFGSGVADGANTLKYTSNTLTVNASTYTLHEGTLSGYTEGSWTCNKGLVSGDAQAGSVAVGNADSVTCTITNDDNPSSLTLVKRIVNDNGGTAVVGDFGLTTDAGSLTFGTGVADGTSTLKYTSNTLPVGAGTYSLVESNVAGYTEGTWGCTGNSGSVVNTFSAGSVGIGLGETVVCTITNNDQASSLTLVKRIVNDNGGLKVVGDFGLTTDAGSLTFGTGVADGTSTLKYTSNTLPVNAGTYTLVENDVTGYTEGTWSCTGNAGSVVNTFNAGSVVVGLGETVVCTITNNDQTGSLTLVKRIVNDDGGTAVVGDFGITTTGGSLTFGAGVADGANTLKYTSGALTVNAGTYTLHENIVSAYAEGTWSCTSGLVSGDPQTGSVAVTNGGSVTCTITNNDLPPAAKITPTQTTCEDFVAGTAQDLTQLLAGGKGNPSVINNVSPGVFFYYSNVTGAVGDVVSVQQTNNGPAGWPNFDIQQNNQAFLYTVSGGVCTKVATMNDGSGQASYTLTAAGSYVIGIKYGTSNPDGQLMSALPVRYTYTTKLNGVNVPANSDFIDLIKK